MRDGYLIKSALISLLLVFSVALLHSHETGSLYPAAHIGLFTSILICVGPALQNQSRKTLTVFLIAVTAVAVTYRLYLFGHPGTYHSIDAEWFLSNVHTVTRTGSIDRLPNSFYKAAPGYIITLSIIQQVTAANLFITQAAVPLFLGVVTPLLAWLFVGHLRPGDYNARLLGATIAAIATFGVFHSWLPIAQSLTAPPFLLCVWLLASYDVTVSRAQSLIPLGILLTMLMFSHKIPVLLLAILLAALAVTSSTHLTGTSNRYAVVALFVSVILLTQMSILTDFLLLVGSGSALPFTAGGSNPIEATAAVSIATGLESTILRGLNIFGILPVGGLAWLYGVYQWHRSGATKWAVTTISIAICTAFALVLIPAGIPTRGLLMIEPALAALIAVGLFATYRGASPSRQYLVGGIIVILLATQAFAVIGMPDGPEQPTRYPTKSELAGKQFAHDYAPERPYMVSRYAAQMTTPKQPETRYTENFLDDALLTGSVSPSDHPSVLHRDRDVYSTRLGWYRLRCSPAEQYDQAYHQPYDNGDTSYYIS